MTQSYGTIYDLAKLINTGQVRVERTAKYRTDARAPRVRLSDAEITKLRQKAQRQHSLTG